MFGGSSVSAADIPASPSRWLCCSRDFYSDLHFGRNNRLVGFRREDLLLAQESGPPLAVAMHASYKVDAKPGGLFYEAGGSLDSLYVVEYSEPTKLDYDGTESAQQDAPSFGTGPAIDHSNVGGADTTTAKASTTKQPATTEAVDQERKERASDESPNLAEEVLPVVDMRVNPTHCHDFYQQCGWAVRQDLDVNTGLPDAALDNELDGPNVLVPDGAFYVGEGVRGFALATQLGRKYAIIERCSFRAGYSCRLEFHRYDDLSVDNGGIERKFAGFIDFLLVLLDPGIPPSDTRQLASDGTTATPKIVPLTPEEEDALANEGDQREDRAKRAADSARRTRVTAEKVARFKKSKGPKPDTSVEKRDLGASTTLTSVIGLPPGATGLTYRVTTSDNYMMVLFASAAQPNVDHMLSSGADIEDSVHLLLMPAMATLPPDVHQNVVYVKYLGRYKIAPRCLLPIGSECQNDKKSAANTVSKPGSGVEPRGAEDASLHATAGRPRARYVTRRLSTLGEPQREMHDADQREAVVPMSPVARQVHARAYAQAGVEAPWGEGTPSRGVVVQQQLLQAQAFDDQPRQRGRNLETRAAAYVDQDRCITTDMALVPQTPVVLFEYSQFFVLGPIPVELGADVVLLYGVDFALTICISDKTVIGTLLPSVALEVGIKGGVSIPYFIFVGMRIGVTLVDLELKPQASLSAKDGLSACIAFDLALRPITLKIDGLMAFFLCLKFCKVCFKIFGKKVCLRLPCGITFCKPFKFRIWTWRMKPINLNLFSICNTPPDSSPPFIGDAFVKAQQTDPETIQVNWGGFRDEESNVHGYTLCIGSSPGAQDVAACQNMELDTSGTIDMLDLEGKDGVKVFASVFAKNGEGLESILTDRLTLDDSAPVVTTLKVMRMHDGRFVDEPLIKHSDTLQVLLLLAVEETSNEENVNIAMVETAVGLAQDSYQDAAMWSEVPTDFNTNFFPVQVEISELRMQHGVEYFVHVRTTNTIGRQTIVTAPTRLFIDDTPPVVTRARPHNGASIMIESTQEWLSLEEDDPVYSATTTIVSPTWACEDPESEIIEFHAKLVEATGDPDSPLAEAYVEPFVDTVTFDGLELQHGLEYEVHIRCLSDANLWSDTAITPAFLIDKTRPLAEQVLDLGEVPTAGVLAAVPAPDSGAAAGRFIPEQLTPAEVAEVDIDFVAELTELRAGFAVWDTDSGVSDVLVAVGTAPGGTSVLDWTPVSADGVRQLLVPLPASASLRTHTRYFVSVTAINGAGKLSLFASSDGVMIDDTPPVCLELRVRDGQHRILDADFQASTSVLTAQWGSALFDLESSVAQYRLRLEDADTGAVIAEEVNAGISTIMSFKELSLVHNQRVRAVVRAINRAGVSVECASDGVQIDTTPPVPQPADGQPTVADGNSALPKFEGTDVEYIRFANTAFLQWADFTDPESGVSNYLVWAEAMDGTALTDKTWVHPSLRQWTTRLPSGEHGALYRTVVRAVNGAGSFADARSDGVEVDTTAPVLADTPQFRVNGKIGLDENVIAEEDATISMAFSAADGESGLKNCRYALGSYPDASDLTGIVTVAATDFDAEDRVDVTRTRGGNEACFLDGSCETVPVTEHTVTTEVSFDRVASEGFSLADGFTFHGWVSCTNNANDFVRYRLPQNLTVDATPPAAGLVFDGLASELEVDLSPSTETFAGNWRWWADFQTGIRYYEAALGTAPGLDDVHNWTNTGLATKVFFSLFGDDQLLHDETYYLSVRATDHGGHSTMASSDGVLIDTTAPQGGLIEHGLWDTEVRRYTPRADLVLMRWSGFVDPESGVTDYEYALSTSPDGDEDGLPDVVPFINVGLGIQAAVVDVALQHAKVYYGTVRGTNRLGMRSTIFSQGVLVDVTPPQCSAIDGVRGSPDVELSTEGVPRVFCECTDLESGVPTLQWGVGTVRGWDNTLTLSPVVGAPLPVPAHLDALYGDAFGDYHKSPWRMVETSAVSLGTKLLDGVRYYGVIYAENGAGGFSWVTTNGQVHDTSPATLRYGRDVLEAEDVLDLGYTMNGTHWGANFAVIDPHTSVVAITVQLLTGNDQLLDEVAVPVAASVLVLRPVPAPHAPLSLGQLVWVRIKVTNGVGLKAEFNTDGWTIDTTPPALVRMPTDGVDVNADLEYTPTPGSLGACWEFEDQESQVDHYLIAARRVLDNGPAPTTLSGWAKVPRSASQASGHRAGAPYVAGVTCAWVSGFEMEQHQTYQVLVKAVNPLGLETTSATSGVTLDWTAPIIGAVTAMPYSVEGAIDEALQVDNSRIRFGWSNITETGAPLTHVEIGVGTRPGLDDVVARVPVPVASGETVDSDGGPRAGGSHTFTALALSDGGSYFTSMWVTNLAGLESVRSSSAIRVDSSPPVLAELPHEPFVPTYTFPRLFDEQPGFPAAVTSATIIIPTSSLVDAHSTVADVSFVVYQADSDPAASVGLDEGALLPAQGVSIQGTIELVPAPAAPFTPGALATMIYDVTLTNNTYIWVEANITNGVNLVAHTTSRAVFVSTETLTAGYVNDGYVGNEPEDDITYQPSATAYSARWGGFTDPRSRIYYRIALGTTPGSTNVWDWVDVGEATSFDLLQTLSVEPGTVVYAIVEARNDKGIMVNATSNGVVMAPTPPVVEDVVITSRSAAALHASTDAQAVRYVADTPVVVVWTASDAVGLESCRVQVHASPGGELLLQDDAPGQARSLEFDVFMDEGQPMYASVACTNLAGRTTTTAASQWAIVETSPPVTGVVWDGSDGDLELTANSTHASAHWFGFSDPESSIADFTACLGTLQDPCEAGEVSVGQATDAQLSGLALVHDVSYFWTVTATNGAGISSVARSNGWLIDAQPPSVASAYVYDGVVGADEQPGEADVDSSIDVSNYELNWGGFEDVESGVARFEVMLGWAPGSDDVAAAVELGATARSYSFSRLQAALAVGGRVFATVRACDNAGNCAWAASNGVVIDSTPPLPAAEHGVITETALNHTYAGPQRTDVDVLPATSFGVSWLPFTDPESGIDHYEVMVVDATTSVPSVVLEWSPVGNATSFTHASLPLQHAHTYVVRVRAVNGAGGQTDVASDGFAIDLTAPASGVVGDGELHAAGDVVVTSLVGEVAAHWTGFTEPDSSIDHYEWCVGTAPGRDDVVGCHSVGLSLSATARFEAGGSTGVPSVDVAALLVAAYGSDVATAAAAMGGVNADGTLSAGVVALIPKTSTTTPTYFSSVTAVSEVGLRTTSYSDGVVIDVQPPVTGSVLDSPHTDIADAQVQASLSTLSASWLEYAEYQTELVHYVVSVGTTRGGDDLVKDLEVAASATNVTLYGLVLETGSTYYTTVTAVDSTGLQSSNSSNGILVDGTPPVPEYVADVDMESNEQDAEARTLTENTTVTVMWSFSDDESGIASYRVQLCPVLPFEQADSTITPCVVDWTPMGLRTRIDLRVPDLLPGVRYAATVEATSAAGLVATSSSSGFFVDATPPVEGDVLVVDAEQAAEQVTRVADGETAVALSPIALQGSWDRVAAQWSAFVDAESEVVGYSVCVGSSPLAADLAPCRDVGLAYVAVVDTSAASVYTPVGGSAAMVAQRGNFTSFYITVIARNLAGLITRVASSAVQVDASPPVAGAVLVGTSGRHEEYTTDADFLCVAAEGFIDLESDIDHFEVCLGTTRGQCNVAAMQRARIETIDTSDEDGDDEETGVVPLLAEPAFDIVCARNVELHHHQVIYATVRAVNTVGGHSDSTSDAVTVVLEDPAPGVIFDSTVNSAGEVVADGVDVKRYGQHRAVGAMWWGFASPVAPAVSYSVAVCGFVSGCNNAGNPLSFFADVGLVNNITLGSMPLIEGEEYRWHVRVLDASGRTSEATSSGFLIDTTPPEEGVVDVLSAGASHVALDAAGVAITDAPLSAADAIVARGLVRKAALSRADAYHPGYAPLHVSWTGFGDPESGVASFRVCVASSVNATDDIAKCRTLPATTTYTVFATMDVNQTAVQLAEDISAAAAAASRYPVPPGASAPTDVRADISMLIKVHACNSVGICVPHVHGPVSVDYSAPVPGFVSSRLDPVTQVPLKYTSLAHQWSARWDEFVDMESKVAFYTVAVVDTETGEYALGPVHVGSQLQVSSDQLHLTHGHAYATEVTAYNYAGLKTVARSTPTVVDTTPAAAGWVYDVFDLDDSDDDTPSTGPTIDADFGDAGLGSMEAAWGGWVDPESGVARYEWAIMAVDPREANPINAERPGELLRAAVTEFLQLNGRSLDLPLRKYGTGAANQLFLAENGLMFTDWLDVGTSTSAYREDIDFTTGVTYVVLLKVINGCGEETLAASDGIVFDRSDPCMSTPHAGTDPDVIPRYLTERDELTAVWAANIDPLHQRQVPFECVSQLGGAYQGTGSVPAGESEDVDVGEVSGLQRDIVDVAVVPLSHTEWRLRRLDNTNTSNSFNTSLLAAGLAAGEEDLSQLVEVNNVTSNTLDIDPMTEEYRNGNATLVDEPVESLNNGTESTVVMSTVQAGSRYASPWSACCSSYSERNPTVLNEEWDWRPITPRAGFGQYMSIAEGRYVVVAARDGMSIFDVLDPSARQHWMSAESLATNAGVESPAPVTLDTSVRVAADNVLSVVTHESLNIIRMLAPATAAAALPSVVAALQPSDSQLNWWGPHTENKVFAGSRFSGAVATDGDLVAVSLDGVLGEQSGRGVAVVRVDSDNVLDVVGVAASATVTFGDAVALTWAESKPVLAVAVPSQCASSPSPVSSATYSTACAVPAGHSPAVRLFTVNADSLSTLATLRPFSASGTPTNSGSFGSSVAAANGIVVVGDPGATDGRGQLYVFVARPGKGTAEPVCTVPGVVPQGGLGYSVSISSADEEGRADGDVGRVRNGGTALVVAGSPAANLAIVVRVNISAYDAGDEGSAVCQTISVVRQSSVAGQSTAPPLYGAGTAVTIGGGMLLFSSPFAATWPTGAGASVSADAVGTGRVFALSFCWAGDVRHAAVSSQANVPSVCQPCGSDERMEWSLGGVAQACEDCTDRECRGIDDGYYFSAINASAPLENGIEYELDVTTVALSGRRNTQTTPAFKVDWTPPETGLVLDTFFGNSSTCMYCNDDIDVNTNATYLAVNWCCGWDDPESLITSYSVSFGTEPGLTDMMEWTPVGLNESFVLMDVELQSGQRYYACVVATNGAGLFSEPVCSDGFVYDDSPPSMAYVFDGLDENQDVDVQSFLNIALASYNAIDNETSIRDFVFSLGTAPGLSDLLAEESGGNATMNGVVNRPFDMAPVEGTKMFANVWAINEVGLASAVMSSDGVVIGKSEVTLNRGQGSTISLDTAAASPSDENEDPNDPDELPDKTVAAVDFPPGAVSSPVTFVGGAVTPEDVAAGRAVNASESKPPANNLKFGDYSFSLKAQNPGSGEVEEGFAFDEPIVISMIYKVGKALEGEAAPEDWTPSLTIYDVATKEWIAAKLTCPEEIQWDEIDFAKRRYSVRVCHLTQFALFYQQRPVAVLSPLDPAPERYWTNTSTALTRLVQDDAVASLGVQVYVVPLNRHPTLFTLSAASIDLDGSSSYDPDGEIGRLLWSVRDVTTGTSGAASLSASQGDTTTLTGSASGVVEVTLTAEDTTNGTRTLPTYFWFDAPPIAAIGSSLASQPMPAASGVWPSMLVHAAIDDTTFSVSINGSASWDPEMSALTPTWTIVEDSLATRYATYPADVTPTVASPPHDAFQGMVTNLLAGSSATVSLRVASQDEGALVDTATVHVVVNALPRIVVTGTTVVFVPESSASFSVANSEDVDGTIVRTSWSLVSTTPTDLLSRVVVSDLGTGSTQGVTVSNVTELASLNFRVEMEDNDAGTSVRDIRVVFKNPSVAVAMASVPVTAITSPPAWDGMKRIDFNGSQSYDVDGPIQAWDWAVTLALIGGVANTKAAALATAGITNRDTAYGRLASGYTAGSYIVTLTVTDSADLALTDGVSIRVVLVPGFEGATAVGKIGVLAPASSTTITAAPAVHKDATVTQYHWQYLSSDVTCSPSLSVTSSTSAPLVASTELTGLCGAGSYQVQSTVHVQDSGTNAAYSETGTVTVVVHSAPTAALTTNMWSAPGETHVRAVMGRAQTVSALSSTDDHAVASYAWSATPALVRFDDATLGQAVMTPTSTGTCVVTVVVTDDLGATDTRSVTVLVLPSAVTPSVTASPAVVVSTSAADGGVSVTLDAAGSLYADGDITGYAWAIVSSTDSTMTPAQATAAFLPNDLTTPTIQFTGSPGAFDYTVQLTATGAGGVTGTSTSVVRVLARVAPTAARIAATSHVTQVPLSTAGVQISVAAQDVQYVWTVKSVVSHAGVAVASCSASVVPGASPRLVNLCGAADYTLELAVSAREAGSATVYSGATTQVVHVHDPPVAVAKLATSGAAASEFASPAADGSDAITWLGHATPLMLSAAASSDEEGSITYSWRIAKAVLGTPESITGASPYVAAHNLSRVAVITGDASSATVEATVKMQGRVWVGLVVTDSEGATSETMFQVWVFSSKVDADVYRASVTPASDDGVPPILIIVLAAAFVIVVVALVVVYWARRRLSDGDAATLIVKPDSALKPAIMPEATVGKTLTQTNSAWSVDWGAGDAAQGQGVPPVSQQFTDAYQQGAELQPADPSRRSAGALPPLDHSALRARLAVAAAGDMPLGAQGGVAVVEATAPDGDLVANVLSNAGYGEEGTNEAVLQDLDGGDAPVGGAVAATSDAPIAGAATNADEGEPASVEHLIAMAAAAPNAADSGDEAETHEPAAAKEAHLVAEHQSVSAQEPRPALAGESPQDSHE